MVELAVILPLMVLCILGILEIGRVLAEMAWVGNSAYNAAVVGAETTSSQRVSTMEGRADQLIQILDDNTKNRFIPNPAVSAVDNLNRTVSVSIQGTVRSITNWYSIPVRGTITGPVFLLDSAIIDSSSLSLWGNDPTVNAKYRGCGSANPTNPASRSGSVLDEEACGYNPTAVCYFCNVN